MLSEHRDKHAARRFLRRRLEVEERKPLRVTTDKHPAYRGAIRWILGRKVLHRTSPWEGKTRSGRPDEAVLASDRGRRGFLVAQDPRHVHSARHAARCKGPSSGS